MDEFFLVGLGLEMVIRSVGLLRQVFGVIDQALGEWFEEGQEILAFDLERVIDEAIEILVAAERQSVWQISLALSEKIGQNRQGCY